MSKALLMCDACAYYNNDPTEQPCFSCYNGSNFECEDDEDA